MKPVCALFLVLSFCLLPKAHAQFNYGIKTGLHLGYTILEFSTVQPNGTVLHQSLKTSRTWPSPLLGAYANFEIGRYFSLQAELMGLHKTWRSDLRFFSSVEQFEYTYLSMPFMMILRGGKLGFELGPAFNYLIIRNNISPSKTIAMEPQRLELAINAGINFCLKQWTLGLRLTNDITPFFRNHHRNHFNSDRRFAQYFHRGYQLSIAHNL